MFYVYNLDLWDGGYVTQMPYRRSLKIRAKHYRNSTEMTNLFLPFLNSLCFKVKLEPFFLVLKF